MLKKQSGRAPSAGKAFARGISTATAMAFLGAAVLAKLLDMEIVMMEKTGYGIMLIHLVSVFAGTKMTLGKAGREGALAAGITGGAYYLLLLAINSLFFGGSFEGLGVTALLVVLGSAAAILTEKKGSGRKGRRRYKIPK